MKGQARCCAVIPTYDNGATIQRVTEQVRTHIEDVIVVDDGSQREARMVAAEIAQQGLAHVVQRQQNGGKGAAVKAGLTRAHELGFTHALQIDADGQHEPADIPRFLDASRLHPDALILGAPEFEPDAPRARVWGRKLTQFWTHVETAGRVIDDPLCGLRVYPVAAALEARARGNRMDFDPEIAVRMVWNGARVINLPTRVRYLRAEDGGISHFRMGHDNWLITCMHTRLVLEALVAWALRRARGKSPGWSLR